MKRLSATLLVGLLLVSSTAYAASETFPRPPEIEPAIRFWTQVYTQVSTDGGLLHDRDNLGVVYEKIALDSRYRDQRQRQVNARKAHYREVLRNIARKERANLNQEERRVLGLWPEGVNDSRLQRAANNIRFQLGQSDKFRAGLVRSGAWEPHIRRTLEDMGLPEELAALPHVESSFNPDAWSRVGAAGLWQFTRATGRRYMRIDHIVDERMDPFTSSIAAARLLEHNYSITDNWAMAITAYNHGLAGIRRAARQVGSKNIATIIDQYESRTWGFASRNFYPAFLAAVDVDFNASKYFGLIERDDTIVTETIELPFYAPVDALTRAFDVDRERLRDLNRALRDPVWAGDKRVPRGYSLRVPAGPERPPAEQLLARVDQSARYVAQVPDRFHRVRSGETLSAIASRYGVSSNAIMSLNNLRSRNFIRAGQTLRLPVPAGQGDDSGRFYTVSRGDTLSGIASRTGLKVSSLAAANNLGDEHRIYPGQRLRVDGRVAEDAQTVASAATGTSADDGGDAKAASAAQEDAAADTAETGSGSPTDVATTETDAAEQTIAEAESAAETTDTASAETGSTATAGEATDDTDNTGPLATLRANNPAQSSRAEPVPALSADPADYSVAADGTIEVQAAETLGHYAEWLDLRASELRRVNNMRYGKPVVIGKRIKLRFSRVAPAEFVQRREAYHEELQARFFEQFRIAGTEKTLVQSGDSLWTLARRADNVPVWLLRQYNPDLNFEDLHPGMPVSLPKVERQADSLGDSDATAEADSDGPGDGSGA
ncbi:LysM peptidoglycan-binding domain-containing protein [Halofilum ochraceum]|uniref:LysM peptidoglycan-binding domain-containing protein n=1 Tax=Halofilum ochraceum TaxID=1611323 RepID=UPI00083726FD|nr:LysM peptidoglycan-binding domain-containing protein [Halofilum ochraceum]